MLQAPGGTEENHEKSQDIRYPDRDLNPELPEYEAGVLSARPTTFGSETSCIIFISTMDVVRE
jgi:hypothetical protein